jgi:hypothetical protein
MSSVRTQSPLCLVWNKLDSVFQLSHSPAGTSKQANCCHAGAHRGEVRVTLWPRCMSTGSTICDTPPGGTKHVGGAEPAAVAT